MQKNNYGKKIKIFSDMQVKIPKEWNLQNMSNIFDVQMGQSPPSSSYNHEKQGLPFYQGTSDFGVKFPIPTTWCTKPRRTANVNTILFSVRAPVGEINLAPSKCAVGRGLAGLLPRSNNLMYCYYLIQVNKNRFESYSQGTTFEAINKDEIIKVQLPHTNNLKEQTKIASILSGVDACIEKTQQKIDKIERLKRGLMQQLLTRGIGHVRFKKVRWFLGKKIQIPEKWTVTTLSKCVTIQKNNDVRSSLYVGLEHIGQG